MKQLFLHLCCLALLASGLVFTPGTPAAAASGPWRVALIADGPRYEYQAVLQGLTERLAELGLIADGDVPRPGDGESLAPMWQWLAENAGGDRLRFVADALYSPEWNADLRAEVKKNLLERLRDGGDIDCVLAFGTWSGQDVGPENPRVPILVINATDAVGAGIIPSADDSGRDNLLAFVQPGRYKRQIRIFHDLIGFSRLGVVYADTPAGRSYVALGEIEEAAGEAGVELVRCTNAYLSGFEEVEVVAERLRACHEDLVRQGADAVYLTYAHGVDGVYNTASLAPLLKAGLPTFAQQGGSLVKRGALLSLAGNEIKAEGIFAAEALEKILDGRSPRSLPQRFESAVNLAVNLRTATLIGWNLPMSILAAVDEFYRDF
jgi:ABC-type uncharacterized transport system substrate-binding protein